MSGSMFLRRLRMGVLGGCAMAIGAKSARAQQVSAVSPASDVARTTAQVLARPVTVHIEAMSLLRAIDLVSERAGVHVLYQVPMVQAYTTPVTVHATNLPLGMVFNQLLTGTRLKIAGVPGGRLAVVADDRSALAQMNGMIVGTVTDASTKRPLRGVTVMLDDATRGVQTDENGMYRLASVTNGPHRVSTRLLGYARQSRTVTVADDASTSVDFALTASATALDQVVVTGTVTPTELKAVPNAITVITAKQIEQRGITKIDQLFRGDIPGLFAQNQGSTALLDEVTMFSRGTTSLNQQDPQTAAVIAFSNPIKTYVDGVEMADPKYLSQIDPKSIERIEILTGPQASTIYGSGAINGVMQIFTKRGTTNAPQVTLNLLSGFVQNNFSNALTPQHDYGAQLSGIEGRLSYNAGGSWNYMGPWTPAKQTARTDGFGGARLEIPTRLGRVTADMTLRRGFTQSLQRSSTLQTITGYRERGWLTNVSSSGLFPPATRTLASQTLGLTLSYAPASWWSDELDVGSDASDTELRYTARGYSNISDTTLWFEQDHTGRRSLRYATTANIPITSFVQATIVAGADAWQNLISSLTVLPQTLTGSLTGETGVRRQPGHNTGGLVQTQLGLKDQLFITYGLRVEWNPNYGADAQPNYAPRYGMAYTQEFGRVSAKLRASYGRSTRPPAAGLKVAQTIAEWNGPYWTSNASQFLPYYGRVFDYFLANPDLAPEHQQGGEGGLELYFGARGSLVVTRYNQTVDGLIAQPIVDSVRTIVPCPSSSCASHSLDAAGYGYYPQYQYLNIGSIRNQGWELQGSMNVGPLATHGTYSWTKSRTIGVNPKYHAFFDPFGYPQYQPGATFNFLPEHTWAMGFTYTQTSSSISLNVTGAGRTTNTGDRFFFQNLRSDIRLPQNRANVSNVRGYLNFNPSYALADLVASRRFASHVEGVLQVRNLTNRYMNDYYAGYATLGRQVKLGGRVRTQ